MCVDSLRLILRKSFSLYIFVNLKEAKLKNNHIVGENNADKVHYNIGKIVRSTIGRTGGTMPEDLLTPNKSLKELEKNSKIKGSVL